MIERKYKQLTVQEESSFILMVLLDEGKSNLPYLILHNLIGTQSANKYYLKKIFAGHRSINYLYFRDKFEDIQNLKFK